MARASAMAMGHAMAVAVAMQSGRGNQDDGAKNGSQKIKRFGHKIGPKAFPDVVLVPLDRKFRPGSF